MGKELGWSCKLGRAELLWVSKVGHTLFSRLLQAQIWHQPSSSVVGGLSKGTVVESSIVCSK